MNLIDLINKAQGERTLNQYALNAGISKAMLSLIKKGLRNPSPDILLRLSKNAHNGVTYKDLMIAAGFWSENEDEGFWKIENIKPISKKRLPLLGDIACGKPIYANEDRESYVEVGTNIKADFCLKARGDSMIGARINDGDIVFIRQQSMVDNGDIAAVIINNEATLKRLYYYPEEKKLILNPENSKYPPFLYQGEELTNVIILGKAVAFQSDL